MIIAAVAAVTVNMNHANTVELVMSNADPTEMKQLRLRFSDMLYENIKASEKLKHPVYDADDFMAALSAYIAEHYTAKTLSQNLNETPETGGKL